MHTAIDVLQLQELLIIYPGEREFPLTEKIRAVGFEHLMRTESPNLQP